MSADRSCLLVIDVQEKLVPAVLQSEQLIENCRWLIEVAQLVKIPVMASEQYPRGLGPTVASLHELIADDQVVDKQTFSCVDDPECYAMIERRGCDQIILAGMEAHVCVLQTALRLVEQGMQVFVVADAISSRSVQDMELSVERMRNAGIHIVSCEMVGFEWLRGSGAEQFKTFSKDFLQ